MEIYAECGTKQQQVTVNSTIGDYPDSPPELPSGNETFLAIVLIGSVVCPILFGMVGFCYGGFFGVMIGIVIGLLP